ncbi:MAG: type II toxin-antitoxin system Phd/YefM family antitoxin [Burkholderiales bacterium]
MGAYSVAEVKAHLSAILDAVASGEEIIITKRGRPVARILREREVPTPIDWATIDAFRERLRKTKASVPTMRKSGRF